MDVSLEEVRIGRERRLQHVEGDLRLAHREAHEGLVREGPRLPRRLREDLLGLAPDRHHVLPAEVESGQVEPRLDVARVARDHGLEVVLLVARGRLGVGRLAGRSSGCSR